MDGHFSLDFDADGRLSIWHGVGWFYVEPIIIITIRHRCGRRVQ
jgi:hypothetical protein